jgi:DcuC family C4-dicarboxylate transporter
MSFNAPIFIAFLVIAATVYFVLKKVDVRLVLFAAGVALASLTLKPWLVFDAFQKTMGNGEVIGPICSAMGYAFVLRAMGADREMVRLLITPLRRVKWLLIPGGCIVGFLTNMAITSQMASAASVGPILVPLMLAAGYHPIIAGATLVLGCSGGGNLFNPGEADIVAIHANAKGVAMSSVLDAVFLPELLGFLAAVVAFTVFSQRPPQDAVEQSPAAQVYESQPINIVKAALPPLPIAMLFLLQPRFHLFPPLFKLYPEGLPVPHAMIVSLMVALLVHRKELSAPTKTFFEGMGVAYANVISLIIAATCFIEGMKAVGLVELLVSAIQGSGVIGKVASGAFPWILGVLSGSGTAPCVAFAKAVLPHIQETKDTLDLGTLAAIGSTFGRTMSPVAAVVIFSSALVNATPVQVVKRTAPALAVGAVVALVMTLLR